ncbi:MAG: putative DNA-binding domain-containing protein [Tahibacter sp.]
MPDSTATLTLQRHFAAHIRDPDHVAAPTGIEPRRMRIYRDLFFNNVESLLSANFPVIHSLRGEQDWHELIRAFLRDHRCHTPLFPELGREFLQFLEQRQGQSTNDPPFLLELAHYEWAELALSLDEAEIEAIPHDPEGDVINGVPVLSPLAWPLAYRFPVQRIRPDFQPEELPENPTLLLLIRDRADQVSFLEINPLTHLLIERLQANSHMSGLEIVQALLADIAPDQAATLLASGLDLLRDLRKRSAVLGTQG